MNYVLTTNEATKDCQVLNKLILSILKDGKIKDGGNIKFPQAAHSELNRLHGIYELMSKYHCGWDFTYDRFSDRVYTQDEQIQNIADFQAYILENIGNEVVYGYDKDIAV